MDFTAITQNCQIATGSAKANPAACNRRMLLVGAALSPLLFRTGRSFAEQLSLTQDDVKNYAQQSVANITASNAGSIPQYAVDQVYGNIADVFNDHTSYDSRYDQTYGDDQLSHYITQGSQNYSSYEEQFDKTWRGPYSLDYYRRKFAQRARHLSECYICGGLIRSQCKGTDLHLILFSPGYAIYQGTRYPANNGFIVIGGRQEPLLYDTDSYYWYFGDNQRLYW